MSLSFWDTLTVDEQGRPTNGVTEKSALGVRVEASRNWLNILDTPAWRPGCPYPPPIIATVRDGEFSYLDVCIMTRHGPQNGLYFVVWTGKEGAVESAMLGCCCYGMTDDGASYLGILPSSVEFLAQSVREWAADDRIPAPLGLTSFADALRFNQGDAYIARGANFRMEGTAPGDAEHPRALTFLKHVHDAVAEKEAAEAANTKKEGQTP